MDLDLLPYLIRIPGIIIGFTLHEAAHAFVADRLGDDTPRLAGRLTLNPVKHVDFFGFMMFLLFSIGWAKPVPVNVAKLKNPARDHLLVSLAGPFANLVIVFFFMSLFKVLELTVGLVILPAWLYVTLFQVIYLSAILFMFNLIPLPPLDGASVLLAAIPDNFLQAKIVLIRLGPALLLGLILAASFMGGTFPLFQMFKRFIELIFQLFRMSMPIGLL